MNKVCKSIEIIIIRIRKIKLSSRFALVYTNRKHFHSFSWEFLLIISNLIH